ncbi:MAG TPA: TonB-dependent receptor [Prolixibacteraceae bacterium]|nr:TonB-dependent receptor [Prolixibacteraceae bacterium]
MNKIIYCVFAFSLFIGFQLKAQNIIVSDQQNRPIENVTVLGDGFTSYTLSNGNLNFFPESGTTEITFLHPNYKKQTMGWEEIKKLNYNIVLEELNHQLSEILVRPTKRTQEQTQITQNVASLSQHHIELYQPQTTADLLNNSNEVFVQKSQLGGGSPMIRGFSANRILLVVDGVRLNNAIYRSGNLHNVIGLDVLSIEQTDIILGPSSVIYGSDALGGVLHFYTIKPQFTASKSHHKTNALLRYSSANFEKTASINYCMGNRKWASLTSITTSDFGDLVMGNHGNESYTRKHFTQTIGSIDTMVENPNTNKQVQSGYKQINAIQKIRFRPNASADFEYAFHFSQSGNIPRYDRLIEYSGDKLKFAEWYYGPQQWMLHSLKAELMPKLSILNTLTVLAAYQDYTESRHNRKFGKIALNSRIENIDIFSLNIDADKYFSNTQTLFYGAEGIYNKVHSNGKVTNISTLEETEIASRYPNGANWWSIAAYANYNMKINSAIYLQAGARYNYLGMNGKFDNRFYNFPFNDFKNAEGAATANMGVSLIPNSKTSIKLNIANGFRAPNIDDAAKVFDSEPGSVIVPNPKLNPEYAASLDGNINWKPYSNLHFELSLFYTRMYNAMVRRDGQINGQDSIMYDGQMSKVQSIVNTSWANIGGVSGSVLYEPFHFLSLKSSLNWQSGADNDGLPLRHIAPAFGSFHLIFKKEKFLIDAYTMVNGAIPYQLLATDEREKSHLYAIDENGNPYCPSWVTLNLKAHYNFSNAIGISAGAENLLNKRYQPYSSGIVAPGLNIMLSVNFKI